MSINADDAFKHDHEATPTVRRFFMVYAAKAGWISAVKDSMMKIVGSGCSLCFVTHGVAGKRKETQLLEDSLNQEVEIEYRHVDELDDLEARLGSPIPKPSVLVELTSGEIVVLMNTAAIDRLRQHLVEADRKEASLRRALKDHLAAKGIASPF